MVLEDSSSARGGRRCCRNGVLWWNRFNLFRRHLRAHLLCINKTLLVVTGYQILSLVVKEIATTYLVARRIVSRFVPRIIHRVVARRVDHRVKFRAFCDFSDPFQNKTLWLFDSDTNGFFVRFWQVFIVVLRTVCFGFRWIFFLLFINNFNFIRRNCGNIDGRSAFNIVVKYPIFLNVLFTWSLISIWIAFISTLFSNIRT